MFQTLFSLALALLCSNQMPPSFPFVDPSIANALESRTTDLASDGTPRFQLLLEENGNLCIVDDQEDTGEVASIQDVALLARTAETFVLQDSKWKAGKRLAPLQRMAQDPASCAVALILALNVLESVVCESTSSSTGRAPLLKNMLEELDPAQVAGPVLKCLLLPTGLNLRNLTWHGFIVGDGEHLRPWLALVLVLIQHLNARIFISDEEALSPAKKSSEATSLLFKNAQGYVIQQQRLEGVIKYGSKLRQKLHDDASVSDHVAKWFIPEQQHNMWFFCVKRIREDSSPIIVSVVLTVLLEHALRLLWCTCNDRPDDCKARPGYFYVTLDGHGQRDRHDVLLHPYVGDGEERNALVDYLGGGLVALLVDLFISGSGGPNVRAALAHGQLDEAVDRELRGDGTTSQEHWEVVDVLLVVMEQTTTAIARKQDRSQTAVNCLAPCIQQYHPVFSFASTTFSSVLAMKQSLERLSDLTDDIPPSSNAGSQYVPLVEPSTVQDLATNVLSLLSCSASGDSHAATLSADIFFCEHKLNKILEPLGATRTLVVDVEAAVSTFGHELNEAKGRLGGANDSSDQLSSRERKKLQRLLQHARFMLAFSSFAAYVAFLHLEQQSAQATAHTALSSLSQKECAELVRRTRMTISTVSRFVNTNAERAIKAVEQYGKAKAVKKLVTLIKTS